MAENKNKEVFESMPVAKALRVMAVPTIISQLIVLIYNLADTFYVGKTNNPYMVAGASLILPVFNIALSFAGLAGVGGGSLVSRLLGKGDYKEAKKVSGFSIYLGISIALCFSLIMFTFMDPILHALGATKDTFIYAKQYAMGVVVAGCIPTVLSNTLAYMLRSTGESKKAGFGITMGGIINMIIDPLFMFVLFPKGFEIGAAAIATCLSNVIVCCYFIYTIMHLDDSIISLRYLGLPTKDSIFSIFNVGIPSCVATLLFDLDYIVIDKLMASYSDVALAAIGIVLKAERLPLNIGVGICQGMVPIIAYNFAAKNFTRMKAILKNALLTGIICAICAITLYECFAPQIMRIFIENSETVLVGTRFLRARALATVLMFMSFFFVHTFNSFGRGDKALFLGVMRWAVFNIPMLFVMNYIFGMNGIVWAQLCADIFTVSLSFYVFLKYAKVNL